MSEAAAHIYVSPSGVPIRNLWYMLTYAWKEHRLRQQWKSEVEAAPTLDALLATILCLLLSQRMRVGLGRDYRQHDALVSGIRGRVLFGESLKRMAFEHGKAQCRFQVYSPNVIRNQIIRSTLVRLSQTGDFGKSVHADELRHRLRSLVRALHAIDVIELKPELIRRHQLQRHDADYRIMLAICHLIIQRQIPLDFAGIDSLPMLDRDQLTLWRVFEVFVANFYKTHLADWLVVAQRTLQWDADTGSSFIPVMKPDLILRHKQSGMRIVLDTKFTPKVIVFGQYEKMVFNRNDLFQMYAYLRSQEQQSDSHRSTTGVLLYPTVAHELSESAKIQGHTFRWETVDLARSWQEIEQRLLSIVLLG